MPEPISIGTSTIPDLLYQRFHDDSETQLKEGLPFFIGMDKIGSMTYLDLRLDVSTIANSLAGVIVEELESRMMQRLIRNHYYYYTEEEKQIILHKAGELLNPINQESCLRQKRKEIVRQKVLDYLELHGELILEGFINFRLKDYQQELQEIVNYAVDEFLIEREYQEFTRLLKYFVEIQEPRVAMVKIIFRKNGKFKLLDQSNQPLQHESLNNLMLDLQENEINCDDLLISALITLAPRELEIHIESGAEKGETAKTIDHVFLSRVIYCLGCPLCRSTAER